jgi:hypothetical protein
MAQQFNRRSLPFYLFISIILFWFASETTAQTVVSRKESNSPFLRWNAKLYPKNTRYIQIEITLENFVTERISTDVMCEVKFFDEVGESWTRRYRIRNSDLKYGVLKRFYVEHKYYSVTKIEGVVAKYSTRSGGIYFDRILGADDL